VLAVKSVSVGLIDKTWGKEMSNFTSNAIKASFIKLLRERPVSKITIKDIVEDCGINRNSFYYHFQDMPALIDEIIAEQVTKLKADNAQINSMEDCMNIALDQILKNKEAVLRIFNSPNRYMLDHYIWDIADCLVSIYVGTICKNYAINDKDREVLTQFYKCQLYGQISCWLSGEMKEDFLIINRRLTELKKELIHK
jgi:AcrR family transcriptional regulator